MKEQNSGDPTCPHCGKDRYEDPAPQAVGKWATHTGFCELEDAEVITNEEGLEIGFFSRKADAQKAVDCVTACAGMAEPQKDMELAREALRDALARLEPKT